MASAVVAMLSSLMGKKNAGGDEGAKEEEVEQEAVTLRLSWYSFEFVKSTTPLASHSHPPARRWV